LTCFLDLLVGDIILNFWFYKHKDNIFSKASIKPASQGRAPQGIFYAILSWGKLVKTNFTAVLAAKMQLASFLAENLGRQKKPKRL